MTRGPGPRVAAMLELLRPVADEIVVAVDSRAEPEVAAALDGVADRLIAYEYAEPVDRPLPWLHGQCSGRWLLTVDDDEIPAAGLIAALRDLAAAEDVTHYWLPRRWLYPAAETWLAEPPWRPDYQLRLVLNDPRLLRFPDETHWPIAALGPARYLDLPLYHADLVLNTLEARERKAERYERLAPGKRVAGRPLNEAYYLPERVQAPRLEPVPEPDLALVRRVLEAAPRAAGEAPQLEVASRQEIDRLWPGRLPAETAYRARLEIVEEPGAFVAGEVRTIDVEVANLGDAVWPWGPESRPEIRLTYRWWLADEAIVEGLRTPLPVDVLPGARELVPLTVAAPAAAGSYRLSIDLVHEHVRWFGSSLKADVEVGPRRLLAVHGPVDLDRLAQLEPGLEPLVLSPEPERVRAHFAGEVGASADAVLLAGLPAGLRGRAVLLARGVRLVRSARRLRRGRPAAYGAAFLEPLARAEALLVVPDGALRRQRWVEQTARRAARALGVRVVSR